MVVVDDGDVDVDEDEDAGSEVWSNEDLISSPIVCDRSLEGILSLLKEFIFYSFRSNWMETSGYH